MTKYPIGIIIAVASMSSVVSCGPASGNNNETTGWQSSYLEGAAIVTGATGVVEYTVSFPGVAGAFGCTGSLIRENAIVTAAHCFRSGGSGSSRWTAVAQFSISYHHPVSGSRLIYAGPATWVSYPTYDSSEQGNAGAANSDMALIVMPTPLLSTDYHDYLRVYMDVAGNLGGSLTAFGAGIYNDAGNDDDLLRTSNYNVQSVTGDHIVVDQSNAVHVCHGDSGGPLVKYANRDGVSIPLLVGDLAQSQGIGDESCYTTAFWLDDSFYSKLGLTKLNWIESKLSSTCTTHSADLIYKRCFDLPFINDVVGEGPYSQGTASALFVATL